MAEAGASGAAFVNACPFCSKKMNVDSDFRRHLEDVHHITIKQLGKKCGRSIALVPMPCKTASGKLSLIRGKLKVLKSMLNENFALYMEHFRRWIQCDITRLEFDTNIQEFFTRETIMFHHDFIVMFLKEIQMISRTFRKSPNICPNSTPTLPAYLNFPPKASISAVFPSSTYSNPIIRPPLSAQLNLTSKPSISTHSNLALKPPASNYFLTVPKSSTFNNPYTASKVSTSNNLYAAPKPCISNHLYTASKPSTSNHSCTGSKSSASNHLYATASKPSTSNQSYSTTKPSTSINSYSTIKSSASSNSYSSTKASTCNNSYSTIKPSTSSNSYCTAKPSASNSCSAKKPSTPAHFSPASKLVPPSHLNIASKEKSPDGNLKKNNQLTNEGINIPNAAFMSSAAGRRASDDSLLKNSETLYALSIVSSWENECVDMQKKEFSRRIIKNIFDHIEQRRESIRVRPDRTIYDTRKTDSKYVNPNDLPKYTGDVTLPEILDTLLANPQLIPRKNMYDKAIRTIMKAMEKGELEIPASSEEENV